MARILKGVKAADLEVRIKAMVKPRIATEVPAIRVSKTLVPKPRIILGSTSTP